MIDEANAAQLDKNSLKCGGCGALLHFKPGTHSLSCQYCGETNEIKGDGTEHHIISLDYEKFVAGIDSARQDDGHKVVNCNNCGSTTVLDQFVSSECCPFCASGLVLDLKGGQQYVPPHYVLPFGINQQQGIAFFDKWLKGLWWAPNDLSKKVRSSASSLRGVYIPHWAYDTYAVTDYTGERGDYYYTTERYTVTINGRQESRTRQVRHTRWSYASGTVARQFDDVLVAASKSLDEKTLTKLGPWDFGAMVKFDERYMSGFRSETYQIDPQTGFGLAANIMHPQVLSDIRHDIGGDDQRIDSTDTDHQDKMIKYVMLPVWVSAYNYNNKVYQFTINANTGEVIGQRPLSWIKITLAILFVLALIALAVVFFQMQEGR
ncbi:PepSY domain-containing protein [Mucilaginibacter myungsuensis]|uniref:PepSY domain-containing protein n=1 Tax=Mucilaginibacter myungsuensis TaxID=649104 RepID=A0A929L1A4_9SPHI|nr:PepSY domain-containing protein [Mucilaginibacter myungsuensis]MBE9664303.1 PepSY domain-containing protein [Mucilaginibacter myungsuensis]MDN3597012.1 PepSY domain-containing protein [Mucilaginibacter myungsuensis]